MCDKMAISTYIMKITENDPFSSDKQYVEIELMQNETNRWSIFSVKAKY